MDWSKVVYICAKTIYQVCASCKCNVVKMKIKVLKHFPKARLFFQKYHLRGHIGPSFVSVSYRCRLLTHRVARCHTILSILVAECLAP